MAFYQPIELMTQTLANEVMTRWLMPSV